MRRRLRVHHEQRDEPLAAERVAAIRRLLRAKDDRIRELEATIADLWEKNACLHDAGQAHIDYLESKNRELIRMFSSSPLVRFALTVAKCAKRLNPFK